MAAAVQTKRQDDILEAQPHHPLAVPEDIGLSHRKTTLNMGKLVLVIGGTGAQGFEVVKALQSVDPPFSIRVLSRDPDKPRVQEQFKDTSVELVKGILFPLSLMTSHVLTRYFLSFRFLYG